MPAVRQILDLNAINRQLHSPASGMARSFLRRGLRVQTLAKKLAPADTGRLRGDISLAVEPRVVMGIATFAIVVGASVQYAMWVHEGTGIYGPRGTPIVPHGGGTYLVFKSKRTGKMVFARSTRGQHPAPFLREALRAARG